MPKTTEDPKFAEHTRRVTEQRREQAISRRKQAALRALTPGTATPGSVKDMLTERRLSR